MVALPNSERKGTAEVARRDRPIHRAPTAGLAVAFAVYGAANLAIVLWLFPSGVLRTFSHATAGLIDGTLVANGLLLAALIPLLGAAAGLSLDDLGLRRRDVAVAVAVLTALWLAWNGVECLWALGDGGHLAIDPIWSRAPLSRIGRALGQLFGNALLEEVLFRGVLLRQLHLRFTTWWGDGFRTVAIAIFFSQAAFALIHLPIQLRGLSGNLLGGLLNLPLEMLLLFTLGVFLSFLYLRTGNLLVVVAVHALSNAPTFLVRPVVDLSSHGWIAALSSLLLLALWPRRRPSAAVAPAE